MPNLFLLFVAASLYWGVAPVLFFGLLGGISNRSSIGRRIGMTFFGILIGLIVVPASSLFAEFFMSESPPWYAVRTIGACCGSLSAFHLARVGSPRGAELKQDRDNREPTQTIASDNPYEPPRAG